MLPKADIILITHLHGDHLDKKAIADIKTAKTMIIANDESAKILGKGRTMKNGDKLKATDWLSLETVPAIGRRAKIGINNRGTYQRLRVV